MTFWEPMSYQSKESVVGAREKREKKIMVRGNEFSDKKKQTVAKVPDRNILAPRLCQDGVV